MKKTKIILINNIPYPPILPFLQKIDREKNILFKVYFLNDFKKYLKNSNDKFSFEYEIFPGIASLGTILSDFFLSPFVFGKLFFENFDVLVIDGWAYASSWVALFVCKLKEKPIIVWAGSTANEKSWQRSFSLPLVKFFLKQSSAFLAYGTRSRDYLISLGARPTKIFIAYNTVDTNLFLSEFKKWKEKRLWMKKEIGIRTKTVILYVGQLIRRKGIKYLLKAYQDLRKEFNDISLLIVGEGTQEQELKRLIRQKKIKGARFVTKVSWIQTAKYYAVADIFVLPSSEEVWGLVINEAMVCGLPVVVSDRVGSNADLIKPGENGFIFRSGDINALVDSLEKIIKDPELAKSMGRKSKKIIKSFTIPKRVQVFQKAISFVLRKENA